MAEVHFVGQILGGTGFPTKGLLCKVGIVSCTRCSHSTFLAKMCLCSGVWKHPRTPGMCWRDSIKARLTQVGHKMVERRYGHIQLTSTINVWCASRIKACPRSYSALFVVAGTQHHNLQGLSGWPKLRFQVWSVDSDGRTDICGYGAVNCPTTPGMYELKCPLWVPEGTSSTPTA
jgi:hypothetical protein